MDFRHIWEGIRNYGLDFAKWILCAVLIGAVCGEIGVAFYRCVAAAGSLFKAYDWLLYLLPAAGLIIAGLYKLLGLEGERGTNDVFDAVREGKNPTVKMSLAVFAGSALTHLCGGSSGREGAALQIGGGVSGMIGSLLGMKGRDMRIITLCGMSAVFSALFGTPLTAALFCVEVINIGMFYHAALLPCIVSSLTAYVFAGFHGIDPLSFTLMSAPKGPETAQLLRVVPLAALCAILSIAICIVFHTVSGLYRRYLPNPFLRAAAGGALVILFTLVVGSRDYNGAGAAVIAEAMRGNAVPWAFLAKLLLTALTLGAGYRGGEIVPTLFIGATFGCWAAPFIGLDAGFGAAIGMCATLCGTVNCPISCIFLSAEVFGGSDLLFFALACAISYMISGHFSLYASQRFVSGKLAEDYPDVLISGNDKFRHV